MIKILGIVIASLVAIILLKNENRHFALLLTIAVVCLIFFVSLDNISEIFSQIVDISDKLTYMNGYIELLLKVLGVTVATQFTADLCRDSGENALATQTESFSKIIILVMTLPLFQTLMNIVTGLLK